VGRKETRFQTQDRAGRRVTTASRNDTPTHKSHRRIVSVAKEEMGNGISGGDWTHSPDSFDDEEMDSGGTSAMGFTNRTPLLDSMNTTAQPGHEKKKHDVLLTSG